MTGYDELPVDFDRPERVPVSGLVLVLDSDPVPLLKLVPVLLVEPELVADAPVVPVPAPVPVLLPAPEP